MAKQAVAERIRFHLPKALPKQTRQLVESAIERHQAATQALIAFLDAADGDPDAEPSLGSVGALGARSQEHWAGGASDDSELDAADPPADCGLDDDELDHAQEDDEPSLGWTSIGAWGGFDDIEEAGYAERRTS